MGANGALGDDGQTRPVSGDECYEGGTGSVLVLLHGLGGTWHIWKPVLSLLERQHRVLAPTLPGHQGGQALPSGSEPTVAALADALIEQLRRRGIQSAHVAGNSLGGWLALELGRRGFAQSVVVFSPAGAWQTPGDYRAIARSFRIVFGAMPLIVVMTGWLLRLAGMRKLLGRQTMEHGERVPATEFRAMLTAMKNTRVLPGLLKTMGRDGPIAPLTTGEVPVRVVWGGCDRVIPFDKYGRPMLLRIPAAQFREIPAVGHVPMYDDPRAVSAAILDFTAAMDRRQTEERARP